MDKQQMRTTILAAKQRLGLDWAAIGQGIGMSPVWTTSACLGMNSMAKAQAEALGDGPLGGGCRRGWQGGGF